MKRFLASLLAILMLVSLLPVSAFAAQTTDTEVAETQEPAQIVSQQLVLGDNLRMRFWVKAESEDTVIHVTVGGESRPDISVAAAQKDAEGNCIIEVTLAAAQMTDDIILQAEANEVAGTAKQYTVRSYAAKVMEGNYAKPTTELVQAMLNYGAGAQTYFAYNTGALANKDYENDPAITIPAEQTITVNGTLSGVNFYGAALVFRDRIALRYYFTGDISTLTVDSGDKPHTIGQKNDMYYVELADINPQEYNTVYTVAVSDGTDTLSVDYSAMHYISRMSTRGSAALQALLKTLFVYHTEAIEYNEWLANCDNLAQYTVVYGDNATANEQAARDMIVDYIQKSTGVILPIIPASEASYSADAKYLVVGDTGLAGMTPASDLGYRGYQIKSKDNSVFVCGGTDFGTLCGAIGFLEEVVGLDAYGHKIVNYEKKSELMIEDFDLTVVPDIDMEQPPFAFVTANAKNMALWGIGQKMFGLIEGSVNHWHNSFDYLPPKDYALTHPEYYTWEGLKPVQLSYTANGNARAFDEMTTICADKIIAAAEADPSLKALTLTQEDGARKWDDSAKAQELYNKYGTNTAGLIIFMNAVADKVKAGLPEGREMDIYFFSYYLTYEPPVKLVDGKYVAIDSEVELRDNVGVMFAPIDDNFSTTDFYSTDMYRQLCGWAALTDNLALWTYQSNFDDYFVFYNSFNTYSDIYKTAADLGVKYSYDQGQWNQAVATGFSDLKAYIIGKLSWNTDADLDALYDDYFAARFGSANAEMRTLFNEMRAYFDELKATYNIDGGINEAGQYLRADRFEKAVLERWLGYIDAALAKADNGAVRQHILLESLAVRYMWIELYGNTLSQSERVIAVYEFKTDCTELFVNMWTEGKPIEKLWQRWENASMTVVDGYAYNFDLSLNAESYEIALPAAVKGTVIGVHDANYKTLEGVTIGANSITVSADAVTAMLGDRAYGDSYLHLTTSDTIYKIKVAIVTKMIGSYSDLYAIKAYQSGNVLDGYFAVANDFDATGEDAICLIEYNDVMWQSYSSGVGFKGIFDGRGHTITGLTAKTGTYAMIGGLFGQILQGAVVRNVAFADMTTDGASAYTYLMTGESCRMMGNFQNVVISAKGDVKQAFGMVGCDINNTVDPMRYTMKNVVISGVDYLAFTIKFPNVFENVILVSDEGVVQELSASIEDENATNSVIRYSTNDELFPALNAENIIAEWEDCDITYANTAINFNGKAIITELMNIVENEAVIGASTNLTVQGSVNIALKDAVDGVSLNGKTLTVASTVKEGTKITVVATSTVSGVTKEFAIVLHRNYTDAVLGAMDVEIGAATGSMAVSGINGNAECLTYGATTVYEGYTIADGVLTISKDLLDAMYLKLGLGEHTIYLGTDASYRYAITLTIATKIINTVEDLESISTTEATLDGYYILNADLDFAGREPFALLAGKQTCYNVPNVGFQGTFDGRGHTISNLTTFGGTYRDLGGVFGQLCTGSVVKNVAFVNLDNKDHNPNSGIGYLLTGDGSIFYGTLDNVAVVSTDMKHGVINELRSTAAKINNCVFLNVNMISTFGSNAQVSNVLSVTANAASNYGGFSWTGNANYNAQPNYATMDDLFVGLTGNNVFENWDNSLFAYKEGQIFFDGKVIVEYDNDLQGEDVIYRGTSQSYISIDSYLDLKEEIEGVTVDWDYAEDGSEILIVTVDSSVPVGTEIVILAEAIDFPSVVKELVVTVQKIYTNVDLTGEGNVADIEVTGGASVAVPFTVEGIGYGDSGIVTEGVSYADGKLSLTKAAIDAIVAKIGLGEKTLYLYTTDDKCYAVTVTLATKIINTVEDLESISTTEATLDGYYVLNADLDCTGKTIALLAGKQSTFGSANIPDVGFKGTFDGRGHIISNLTTTNGGYRQLGGVFGQICAGAVVKNVAFVNLTSTSNFLISGDGTYLHGTMENVVVIGRNEGKRVFSELRSRTGKMNNCFFANIGQINNAGGDTPVSNILSVTANAASNYGGFAWSGVANYNAQPNYATMDSAIDALAANNFLANWANSLITYADGQILFNGKVIAKASLSLTGAEVIVRGTTETYTSNGIISVKNAVNGVSITDGVLSVDTSVAENTVITLVATHSKYSNITTELNVQVIKVYEQIDWTDRGSIGDLETADSYSFIKLPEDINGTVNGISYGENAMVSVSVSDGELAIPKSFVTEIYKAYGYTEQSVKLYTSTDKCYTVKMAIVTKAIANFAELQSIATTNATLDGYYVLTQDIGGDGTTLINLATYATNADTGFVGTFDGRGHSISNVNVGTNGLFNCTGKGTVKNLAVVNAVGSSRVLCLNANGTTFENVFVSSDSCLRAIEYTGNCTIKNMIAVLPNGQNVVLTFGAANVNNTISNVYSVIASPTTNNGWSGTKVVGFFQNYYKKDDPKTLYNLKHYTTVAELLTAMGASDMFSGWNSPFSFANGKLYFGGTPLFFEEVALSNPINLGDVSTVAKETVIDVPAEITGNIIGISTATTGRMSDGITYENGKLTLTQKAVENLATGGWGENSLKIYTDEGKVYSVSIFLVTKIIKNQADLLTLATGKTLDGYFVLANDIVCDGTTAINFACYATDANTGFIGTFDGRGHSISNVNVGAVGLFNCTGKGTIKNLAVVNAVGSSRVLCINANGTTFENVFVSSDSCLRAIEYTGNCTIKNMIAVLPNGQNVILTFGAAGINNTISNVYSVIANPTTNSGWSGTKVVGFFQNYYKKDDPKTLYNLKHYTTVADLLAALAENSSLTDWNSSFSYADGKLSFGENVVAQ